MWLTNVLREVVELTSYLQEYIKDTVIAFLCHLGTLRLKFDANQHHVLIEIKYYPWTLVWAHQRVERYPLAAPVYRSRVGRQAQVGGAYYLLGDEQLETPYLACSQLWLNLVEAPPSWLLRGMELGGEIEQPAYGLEVVSLSIAEVLRMPALHGWLMFDIPEPLLEEMIGSILQPYLFETVSITPDDTIHSQDMGTTNVQKQSLEIPSYGQEFIENAISERRLNSPLRPPDLLGPLRCFRLSQGVELCHPVEQFADGREVVALTGLEVLVVPGQLIQAAEPLPEMDLTLLWHSSLREADLIPQLESVHGEYVGLANEL